MTTPNPLGLMVTCVRCRAGVTFSRDALCATCRHPKVKR
jgi:hypothetical protein